MTSIALILTLTGKSSILTADYFPSLELERDYVDDQIDLQTYHSIPNIEKRNKLFHIGERINELPEVSYEVDDIVKYITKRLELFDPSIEFSMKASNNTLKCELRSVKAVKDGKQ